MKAIRVHQTGGPEVLRWEDGSVGEPGTGEARVRHTAVGLNYVDVYYRTGLYKAPSLPFTPGSEAAGVVEAVGAGVTDIKAGMRVAYGSAPLGAYAHVRLAPADRLVPLPEGIDDKAAAAVMLKGMTAHYLLLRIGRIQKGDRILFHAAAGGVGLIACQWARALGAVVIGTVGSDEKAELARAHGCQHVSVYTRERFVDRVRDITGGQGVRVVYDSVGKDTLLGSLDCLQTLGMVALFGQSSGPVPSFDPALLARGSFFITRPSLFHYVAAREDLLSAARALFDVVLSGAVKVEVRQTYPLAEAARAHRDLEARRTTGSTVLLP
ncbi:MAG: quinone oxidoreductase [Acidobacteria bacterium]|nr:MAG: quinone oxidoreductase [Acidobacteriota bacterium]PYQ21301.1 MAG: quinone oxidoreductase [Acidobacteriota bacterium]